MQERSESLNLDYYIKLALKRRWLIIIPLILSMIVGICLAIALPKIYRAYALVLVRPQRVQERYVRSTIDTEIESTVQTIKQEILSRSNLEKIINRFNPFSSVEQTDMLIEDKVAYLRQQIKIQFREPSKNWQNPNSFFISFEWEDPEIAMRVTNALADSFINENLKVRESQAVEATDFFDDQLRTMRERLKELDEQIRGFREKYMGELPEQLNTNLRMLDNLQSQLDQKERSLRDAKNRLLFIQNEIKAKKELFAAGQTDDLLTLPQLVTQLANLQTKYSDQHPDVIRLKAQIKDLEAKYESGGLELTETLEALSSKTADQVLAQLLSKEIQQQTATEIEINDIKMDIAKLNHEIDVYQQRIERTPTREEHLQALKRDYENLQHSYQSLLGRKLNAEIAVNMEKKQISEQFTVLNYAYIPEKPVSPNLKILFILAIFAGLNIGGGLIFLLEYFDTSLKNPEQFEVDLGVPVLAAIPQLIRTKDKIKRTMNLVFTVFFSIIAILLFTAFGLLAIVGVEPAMEFVQEYLKI